MRTAFQVLAATAFALVAGQSNAADYHSPKVGAKYHFTSTISGNIESEILATAAEKFNTRTVREIGGEAEEERLYGILSLPKSMRMGILPGDLRKAAAIFPLRIGNKVSFETYGYNQTTGNRWFRSNAWEVLREYEMEIGTDRHKVFVIKTLAESPGFYKLDALCDYSVVLATCIKQEGETFTRGRDDRPRNFSAKMTKAVIDGIELQVFK